MKASVGVGIIGAGGMGGRHAANLTDAVAASQVTAVMDVDPDRARETTQRCGGAAVYADPQDLIAAAEVDAVVVAAPDRFHAGLARACVAAGKPVLCEKPLATNNEDARRVTDEEQERGRRFVQVGFMRQYDPAHVAAKRLVDSGRLGRRLVFRGVHVNPSSAGVRTLREVVTGSVIHDIHSARWMMQDEVVRVHTSYIPFSQDRPDSARYVMVQLRFASGALGGIECNASAGYGYEVAVSIAGETGVVETGPFTGPVVRHGSASGQRVEDDWLQRFETAYVEEARSWVQSVLDGAQEGPNAWDGYVSMLVADACIESGRRGRPVDVDLPRTPSLYARPRGDR